MTAPISVQTDLGTTELTQPIIPSRYVWHVSNSFYQKKLDGYRPLFGFRLDRCENYVNKYFELAKNVRESISEQGLICPEGSAVFANHNLFDIKLMHPIWLDDKTDIKYHPRRIDMEWMTVYDFWMIDTHAFEATWYIDPFMEGDIKKGYIPGEVRDSNYICTLSPVPKSALTLYRFDMKTYQKNKTMYVLHNGGLKAAPFRDLWDAIKPDEKVNSKMKQNKLAA